MGLLLLKYVRQNSILTKLMNYSVNHLILLAIIAQYHTPLSFDLGLTNRKVKFIFSYQLEL